jgi:predicted metal-dependent hydrolase
LHEITIDKIVRSKRRTIALVVTQEATLVVRAPIHTPLEYIKRLVNKKSAWIRRKLSEAATRNKIPVKECVNGEGFLYLGNIVKLCIAENAFSDIELNDKKLYLSERAVPKGRDVLKRWYKGEALKIISARCERYAEITGCTPRSIKITNAQKRWGSCGAKGTLNFSWRLIMAPIEVIDYVIVHELVHIERLDHSKLFWDKVRGILPDYKQRKKWLKENDGLLAI